MKRKIVYFLRWQLSTLVMMPFMWILKVWEVDPLISLIIVQTIGSLIFYNVDKFIFKS